MKAIAIFGATSGIAQATARLWAAKGVPMVLVARNPQKLAAVADDLRARGAKQIDTVTVDLDACEGHGTLWRKVREYQPALDGAFIAWGDLGQEQKAQVEAKSAQAILHTNFNAPVSLLTTMVSDFEKQGHGQIGVITSVAGDRGRKSLYVYGSAKGGLQTFLSGYRARLRGKGIYVHDLRVGLTDTQMTKHVKRGPMMASPEKVARGILCAFRKRKPVAYVPGRWRLVLFVVRMLPEAIFWRLNF